MSTPIAFLRHAATAWNADHRLQGMTDTPLSAVGEAQARSWQLPEPIAGWRRYCSPLQRARRTAELLHPPAPVTISSALREMSFGVWEGHTIAELRLAVGPAFIAEESKGLDFQPPLGESPRAVILRLQAWLATLDQSALAVSHKAVIRALLSLATGWDMTDRPPWRLDWRRLQVFEAGADGSLRLCELNVPLAQRRGQ
ncbi:MAG: histidine phosphatase family protein [Alphaproteobacteria bacterium]|nr:histidine phosphatase family protein [Alphaproteobacteria bacterium]